MSDTLLISQLLTPFRDELLNQFRAIVREEISAAVTTQKPANGIKYLTRKEVCDYLGITLSTVNAWTKSGKLTGYRVGRKVRYKADEIDASLSKINIGK